MIFFPAGLNSPAPHGHRGSMAGQYTCLFYVQSRGLQRDVVYLGWPIAPSYNISPNAGEREVVAGGQRVQLYTGAQINFGDLTSYLTYMVQSKGAFMRVYTTVYKQIQHKPVTPWIVINKDDIACNLMDFLCLPPTLGPRELLECLVRDGVHSSLYTVRFSCSHSG